MTLAEYHVKQADSTKCQWFNCAASSGAMAIWWGTGTTKLTSYQVRVKSGISCIPGEDTRSGGLRAVDVQRVAALYGVQVNYGPGGLTNWPAGELYNRLNSGYGAIVLGDAQDAPVNPSSGVVYHSAWVHGLRTGSAGRETHWHDPRLGSAYWVPLAAVDRYQVSMESVRFSGFVALADAPDTGTSPTTGGVTAVSIVNPRRTAAAQVRGKTDGDRKFLSLLTGTVGNVRDIGSREVACVFDLKPAVKVGPYTFAGQMYMIGRPTGSAGPADAAAVYPHDVDLEVWEE